MLSLEDQTVERLDKLQSGRWAPQGPCAGLAWAWALYLVERYHPTLGLDYLPAGQPAPGFADWHGVRVILPAQPQVLEPARSGLIRFWDAAVADERTGESNWSDLGRRFLEGRVSSRDTLVELRTHLGLPDYGGLPCPVQPPRWIFYLTLLRAGVDLIVDDQPVSLTRGLEWSEILAGGHSDPHPLVQARVLGVRNSGAREWLGLTGFGSTLFVHRRDARLIDWQGEWRVTPAAGWLPDASWRLGQYLAERLRANAASGV